MKKLLNLAAVMFAIMLSLVACDQTEKGTDGDDSLPNLENVKPTFSTEKNSIVISLGEYAKTTVTPNFENGVCVSYSIVEVWAKESWAEQIMERIPQQYIGATRNGKTITATYSKDILGLDLIGIKESEYKDFVDALLLLNNNNSGNGNGGSNNGGNGNGGNNNNNSVSYAAPTTMNFGGQFLSSVQAMENSFGRKQDTYNIAFGTNMTQSDNGMIMDFLFMNYGYQYTVRSTSPLVFMADSTTYPYESYTDKYSLALNESGYVTEFKNNDTQVVGRISYNRFGMIESIEWRRKYSNNNGDQEVNANYRFSNDGETLYGVTGQINITEVYDGEEEVRNFGIDIQFHYPANEISNATRQQTPIMAKIIGGYMGPWDDIVSNTASRFALLGYFGKGSDKLPSGITITKIWQYEESTEEDILDLEVDYTFRNNGALDTVMTYQIYQEEEERYDESAYVYSYYGDQEEE